MPTDIVSTTDLVKQYRGKPSPAVDGISFDIQEGEIIGLLGPNGAGKTTLIKMICGVTMPTAGQVRVFGADPIREPIRAKVQVGAMHQSGPFDEMLSALDNLRIATRFRGLHWPAAQDWIREVAGFLDLSEALPQLVFQLSGGQRQRLQLVRALITIPRLLILDEPSAGLDVVGRHHVERFVRWLRRDHGVTVLWTSHHIDELERNAERVLIVNRGRVVRFAEPGELIREFGGTHVLVTVEDLATGKLVLEWAEQAGAQASADGTEVRVSGLPVHEVMGQLPSYCGDSASSITGVTVGTDSLEDVFLRMTTAEVD
jgi:ABC-2 type transport system ATP-binding protein